MSKVYEALKKAELERVFEEEKPDVEVSPVVNKEKESDKKQEGLTIIDTIEDVKEEVSNFKTKDIKELVVLNEPQSQASEQFKKLRTKVLNRTKGDNCVLLITSALPLEGKSFVTANLAVTFALNPDTYSLIIDADFRKPSLHSIFKINYKYGLSDYLEGKTNIGDIFYKTFLPKLSIIPAGNSDLQPSELLSSDKMKNFIKEVKKRYPDRFIFVDTTPMLLTSEPDILASQVDGTLMVVGFGLSSQDDLKKSLEMLEGNSVWGIIFNKIDLKSEQYHKYSYYQRSR